MRELKALYIKDGVTENVLVLDTEFDSGGDLICVYIDSDGKLDSDEAEYFTVTENNRE